jgi:LPS-assembly protein
LESLNTVLSLWNGRGDRIALDYRFTHKTVDQSDVIEIRELESVRLSALWQINQSWLLNGAHERNLFEHEDIETRVGIGYRSQCWGLDLDWRIEDGNQSYEATFNLLGLGSFGN